MSTATGSSRSQSPRLNSGDAEQADTARRVLVYVLDKALKLLHPFMPFITEELYQALPGSAETIMTQSWPTVDDAHNWAGRKRKPLKRSWTTSRPCVPCAPR